MYNDMEGFVILGFGVIVDFIMLERVYLLQNIFEKEKTKKSIKSFLERILLLVVNFARKILDKSTVIKHMKLRFAGQITGFNDEKISINHSRAKRKKKKYKKYKEMNNIERVRYFYDKKTYSAKKKGVNIELNNTPNEAFEIMKKAKYIKEEGKMLISEYNNARYNDKAEISDEIVEKLRKI